MNEMTLEFEALLENEVFARTSGVAFLLPYNLSVDELMEIKTILAEMIVNSIVHGYQNLQKGRVVLKMSVDKEYVLTLSVSDNGVGINDIEKAKEPLFTTRQDMERSGMGFTIIDTFSDDMEIDSTVGTGTKITIHKKMKFYG